MKIFSLWLSSRPGALFGLALIFGLAGLALPAIPAGAHPPCLHPKSAQKTLQQYGEQKVFSGEARDGAETQLYVAPPSLKHRQGTYTVVLVLPSGLVCFLSAGTVWELTKPGERT